MILVRPMPKLPEALRVFSYSVVSHERSMLHGKDHVDGILFMQRGNRTVIDNYLGEGISSGQAIMFVRLGGIGRLLRRSWRLHGYRLDWLNKRIQAAYP